MGRLTTQLRASRADPSVASRLTPPRARRSACSLDMFDVAEAAYFTGRSCYFRPLFDRPRQWAEQRSPRPASSPKTSGAA
jgi:hypothetical protein